MPKTLDIMDRLANHCAAALMHDGDPVTKSDAFYGDKLGALDAEQQEQVLTYCRNEGCEAEFVGAGYGVNLRIRKATR